MATVRIQKNILDEKIDTFSVESGVTIETLIREHTDGDTYENTLVECYDAETGKTYFAPIEEDSTFLNAIVQVNGKDKGLDYELKENDIVAIIITPSGGWSWEGALKGSIEGMSTGFTIGAAIGGWGILIGAAIGLVSGFVTGGLLGDSLTGWLMGLNGDKSKGQIKDRIDSEKLPDVRGAANQPLLDQTYPFVIGKHLVTPFIIGSPWNEISGNRGQENYIHILYAVGYAPLRLTDFKLGDMFLAHNQRWADNQDMRNIFHGALTGIDEGNNNRGMDYYQSNTTIDLRNRPQKSAADMRAKGWDVEDGEVCTVFSSAYSNSNETKTVLVTPILSDGTVLTPEQLETYANQILAGQTPSVDILLNTFNGADSVSQSEVYAEGLHTSQATYYGQNGDIVNTWANNDITLEILQQGQNGEAVDYGNVYPYAKIQEDIKANVLYIADGTLTEIDSGNSITYQGLGLKNGLRNNVIRFTEQYPKSATVELDFANGLYKSRSETSNDNSEVKYYRIPMWVAIQWRVYSDENPKCDGSLAGDDIPLPAWNESAETYYPVTYKGKTGEYRGWNTFANINGNTLSTAKYSEAARYTDIAAHTGNSLRNEKTVPDGAESTKTAQISCTLTYDPQPYGMSYTYSNLTLGCSPATDVVLTLQNKTQGAWMTVVELPKDGTSVSGGTGRVGSNIWRIKSEDWTSAEFSFTEDVADTKSVSIPDTKYSADINDGWLNSQIFNLEALGGTNDDQDGINEIRCVTSVDFVEWSRQNLLTAAERSSENADTILAKKMKAYFYGSSNSAKSIEIRVVRISPCYLDEIVSTKEQSAFKFSDVFTWSTLTSEVLDGDKLIKDNQIVQKRPLTDERMRKLCVVSLKAKTDNVDQLTNSVKKLSCIAQSFSPYYNESTKKWVPESVTKVTKYYRPPVKVDKNGNRGEAAVTPPFTYEPGEEITQQQFYEDRQNGIKSTENSAGNNFVYQIVNGVIRTNAHKDPLGRYFIPYDDKENGSYKTGCDGTLNYCKNIVSSMFLLAGIGPQLGVDALGYEQNYYSEGQLKSDIGDFDTVALAKWNEELKEVKDGSYYPSEGYHYNAEGERVHHNAGDEVKMYFTANAYVYQPEMLESIFAKIAIAGRAVYTRDSKGRITVIMDKPEKYPVALINQQNTLKSTYIISYEELPSGLQITFPDEDDGYQQNDFYCMRDGEDAENPKGAIEQYKFDYVTNNYQQNSLGTYLLANRILNREVVTKQLGIEGASIGLGNLVLVSDDTMLIGTDTGARISKLIEDSTKIYGFLITNSYKYTGETEVVSGVTKCKQGCMVMQPSQFKEYKVITLRLATNNTSVTVDNVVYKIKKGNTNIVLFDVPITKTQTAEGGDFYYYQPKVDNLVSFGIVGRITSTYRIIKIKGNNNHTFDFTLSKYQEDLYNYGRALPSFQNNMTLPDRSGEDSFALSDKATRQDVLKDNTGLQNAMLATVVNLYANHIVTLYKTSSEALTSTGITSVLTYDFSNDSITWETPSGSNGWSKDAPADLTNCWVTSATAHGKAATDDISANEWARPIKCGLNGVDGINTCTISLYKRLSTTPTTLPQTLTYRFDTGSLLGEKNGWQTSIPDVDEGDNAPCWEIHATALSTSVTDTIEASEWSPVAKITQDGYSKEEIMSWIEEVQIESPNIYVTPSTGIFAVDDDGVIVLEQSVNIEVKVIQTNEEIDFAFGAIHVPDGFSIVANNHILTLTAQEGTKVTNCYFDIPIVFRQYSDNYYYGDTDGNAYVHLNCQDGQWYGEINSTSNLPSQVNNNYFLWTGADTVSTEEVVEGGTFKQNTYYYSNGTRFKEATYISYGMSIQATVTSTFTSTFGISTVYGGTYYEAINAVANIPSTPIVGDFFTWTGADQTSASIVQGGKLLAGCCYKWNGVEWIRDTSSKHRAIAMKELMSVAENKLAQNNSDVIEYIRELITMNVVTENIQVTGEALINSAIVANLTLGKQGQQTGTIQSWNFSDANNTGFKLSADGTLVAKQATIKGDITATSLTLAPNATVSGFASVATSGNYSDLNGKPTIPDVSGLATSTSVTHTTENGVEKITVTTTKQDGTTSTSTTSVIDQGDYLYLTKDYGTASEQHNTSHLKISKQGLLEADNAVIHGTIYATNGEFTGVVHATNGEFTGVVNATNGVFKGAVFARGGGFSQGIFTSCHMEDGITQGILYFGGIKQLKIGGFSLEINDITNKEEYLTWGYVQEVKKITTGQYIVRINNDIVTYMQDTYGIDIYNASHNFYSEQLYGSDTNYDDNVIFGIRTVFGEFNKCVFKSGVDVIEKWTDIDSINAKGTGGVLFRWQDIRNMITRSGRTTTMQYPWDALFLAFFVCDYNSDACVQMNKLSTNIVVNVDTNSHSEWQDAE